MKTIYLVASWIIFEKKGDYKNKNIIWQECKKKYCAKLKKKNIKRQTLLTYMYALLLETFLFSSLVTDY